MDGEESRQLDPNIKKQTKFNEKRWKQTSKPDNLAKVILKIKAVKKGAITNLKKVKKNFKSITKILVLGQMYY